jgi:hypothetical protein
MTEERVTRGTPHPEFKLRSHSALSRKRGGGECNLYSATISPLPPNSEGKSFSFGRPSRIGSTVSA